MKARAMHLVSVILVALLSACATGPQFTDAERASILTPISCASRSECDVIWSRLQAWVATNSTWRIQTANDVIIQTFGPGAQRTDVAYSLVRTPQSADSAIITIRAGCDNIFGCHPDPVDAIHRMKAAVGK